MNIARLTAAASYQAQGLVSTSNVLLRQVKCYGGALGRLCILRSWRCPTNDPPVQTRQCQHSVEQLPGQRHMPSSACVSESSELQSHIFRLSASEAAAYFLPGLQEYQILSLSPLLLAASSGPDRGSARTESSCKMGTTAIAAECSCRLWGSNH